MKLLHSLTDPRRVPVLLAGALAFVFLFLFFRNAGIYPIVFIDEWIYSSAARSRHLAEAQVPSYLYFGLYRLTQVCGDSYLDCNRLLNSLFYVLAAPLFYLLARRVAPAWLAALLALALALSPANAFTPFFMPEAMYSLAFWALTWSAMWCHARPGAGRAALLGVVLGLAILVKLHALFLAPALALFQLYSAAAERRGDGWRWLRRGALWAALTLGTAMLVRLGLGWLAARGNGLDLMGSLYSGQAAYTAKTHYPLPQLIGFAWHNLQGHLMLLGLLFAAPLAALLAAFNRLRPADQPGHWLQSYSVYTLLVLGSLLGVTILFTASITGLAVGDGTARIHTRYYDFALPLLLLCAAAAAYAPAQPLKTLPRLLLGGAVLLLIWHGRAHLLQMFAPGLIDSPELHVLAMDKKILNVITVLSLLGLLAWSVNQRLGLRLFFLLVLPAVTVISAVNIAHEVRLSIWADPASKAGLFARHYLTADQSARLTIVSPDLAVLQRARFFIENPSTELLQLQPGEPLEWSRLKPGTQWVMVIGQREPPADARVVARKDDLLLFQTPALSPVGQRLAFSQPLTDYARVEGLAWPDTWGAWSVDDHVSIEFARALPKRFALRLEGRAYGPNIGREVDVTVASQRQTLRLPAQGGDVTLHFETDGTAHGIRFKVPQPTSPAQLGLEKDTRPFGIGFEHLTISDDAP